MSLGEWLSQLEFDDQAKALDELHTFDVCEEHGQSFAICVDCGASYSICFANIDGRDCFVLEQVSEGDEEYACWRCKSEGGPPYDAATATGMYDREDG